MVNYNHIETQVKRFDTTAVTTEDVKYTKIPRNLAMHRLKKKDGLTSLLYQGWILIFKIIFN